MTIRNRQTQCFAQDLTLEWTFSLIFIFCGCVCLTSTLGLTIAAQWDRSVERYSRWAGFLAGTYEYTYKNTILNYNSDMKKKCPKIVGVRYQCFMPKIDMYS
jgi:hypothetical protein